MRVQCMDREEYKCPICSTELSETSSETLFMCESCNLFWRLEE
jgi:ribosomal protein L37AE/L43A